MSAVLALIGIFALAVGLASGAGWMALHAPDRESFLAGLAWQLMAVIGGLLIVAAAVAGAFE